MRRNTNKLGVKDLLSSLYIRIALVLFFIPLAVVVVLYWVDYVDVLMLWVGLLVSVMLTLVYLVIVRGRLSVLFSIQKESRT